MSSKNTDTRSETNSSNVNTQDDFDLEEENEKEKEEEINLKSKVLNNKYIAILELGHGSYATVWLSYNISDKQFYAIKVHNVDDYKAGLKELDMYKKISKSTCMYLNKLLDDFEYNYENNILLCLVFELQGGTLDEFNKLDLDININIKKNILKQLLLAISELNKYNIIHTDIKVENILISGLSSKIQHIIDVFRELNFNALLKKNKKKKNKNVLEKTSSEFIEKVFTRVEFNNNIKVNALLSLDEYAKQVAIKKLEENLKLENLKRFNNITIKLADFGTCVLKDNLKENITENLDFDIQTRYYRAPEVILNHNYNETVDIWSVGCVAYELFTKNKNKLLFDPDKDIFNTRDKCHLRDIISVLGPIPEYILLKGIKTNLFFTQDNILKFNDDIQYISLSSLMYQENKEKENKEKENKEKDYKLLDLMYKMFHYDPKVRIKVNECLKHEFFMN